MADIQLDANEVRAITDCQSRADYPGGYAYISAIIGKHPEFDRNTAFWFEKARLINMDIRSDPADIYIRSVTACGLRWDGKMGGDRVANARMLQQTSDNIAKAVLTQVVNSHAITNVNIFLNQDIVGALASGQTIGGWGGAFYYWNAPYVPDGAARTTVGQYILSHPDEREKLVACNAAASLDAVFLTDLSGTTSPFMNPDYESQIAVGRVKLLLDGLKTNGQAQAPQFIKDEIRHRATDMVLGRRQAGDPDHIGDYTFRGNGWSAPRVYHTEGGGAVTAPTPEQNPDILKQLNARRAVRQSHSSFTPVPAF